MNIQLIAEQIGRIHLTLETQDSFEVYGGTWLGSFEVTQTGTAQWTLTVREQQVAAAPLRDYKVYARQLATGREWEVLSGKILVSARTAAVPADKLAPVEYFVTVPVVDHDVDAVGSTIVQGIPGPQGPKGDPGPPGEGGMTDDERAKLAGAAQRDSDNTFTASNTFTGEVDMSGAQVTPPEGWNVGELTAEQVQAVVPMAWDSTRVELGAGTGKTGNQSVVIGAGAFGSTSGLSVAIGYNAKAAYSGVAIGLSANGVGTALGFTANAAGDGVAVGSSAVAKTAAVAIGKNAITLKATSLVIGAKFTETTSSSNVTHTCTTEGTGSITIGAGANTLNTTDADGGTVESSNSVTIGCKALNQGADSIVIGVQASGAKNANVVIGAGANSAQIKNVAIGANAKISATSYTSTALGANTSCSTQEETAVGYNSKTSGGGRSTSLGAHSTATQIGTTAIGYMAKSANEGCVVFSSLNRELTHKTQFYFSGANTPLANEYEDGEAMMGYVVTDRQGNILTDAEGNAMVGTQKLSVLFPNNRGENAFTPAALNLDEGWTPKPMFHPSDLDMPQEEPSEPEEYQPLPVWPIVEPEDLPPHAEIENS